MAKVDALWAGELRSPKMSVYRRSEAGLKAREVVTFRYT